MEVIIYAGIVLTALGVCAAYVDFITSTIPEVFPILSVADVTLIVCAQPTDLCVVALLRRGIDTHVLVVYACGGSDCAHYLRSGIAAHVQGVLACNVVWCCGC